MGPLDSPDEIDGAALETLFLQEVRALNDYLSMGYKIFYWKTPAGIEVDFVLYGERGLKAFEIKKGAALRAQDFSGLRQFLASYPAARAYLFYGGTRHYFDSSVEVIPIGEGLQRLPDLLK